MRTCARNPLAEAGHTPGSGLGCCSNGAWLLRASPYSLSALVLGTAAGREGAESGPRGQVRAALGHWHQFAHSFKRHSSQSFSLTAPAGKCPVWMCRSLRGEASVVRVLAFSVPRRVQPPD